MDFSFLTYNTLFNKGFEQLGAIISKYHPDIICLQEVNTNDKNLDQINKLNYRLADYSNSFIKFGEVFGVATFYNPDKFAFLNSDSLKIATNLSELFFNILRIIFGVGRPKTVLKTEFLHKPSREKIVVCNAHLIVLASNAVRINHITKALKTLDIKKNSRFIIAGDFNYLPYRRRKLEKIMKKYGLIEATRNIRQTIKFFLSGKKEKFSFIQGVVARFLTKLFSKQLKYDYIFYRKLKLVKTERIDVRFSDHYPIISYFKLAK